MRIPSEPIPMLSSNLSFMQAVQSMSNFDQIQRAMARYREPWRDYHDGLHLSEVRDHLFQAEHDGVRVVDGVAAWGFVLWHDAIYDPQAAPGRNEALSAQLCKAELSDIAQPVSVERACQSIRATADHVLPDLTQAPDAALLLDCDLAILAAEPSRFAAYDASIRREYSHVPEAIYLIKRSEVLAAFLRRHRIYHTAWAWQRWESRARANLEAESARF